MICPTCSGQLRPCTVNGREALWCKICENITQPAAPKSAKRSSPEDDMLRLIVQLRDAHLRVCPDLRWLHHGAGESVDARRGAIMRGKGAVAGILDLEWPLLDVRRDPLREGTSYYQHGLGIELKVGKAEPTAAQKDRIEWLRLQGWFAVVCRSVNEAWREIYYYGGWSCDCDFCSKAVSRLMS